MSGARAAKASEALGLTSMMAWLGRVPRRAAGGRGMCRDVCSFRILYLAEMEAAPTNDYGFTAMAMDFGTCSHMIVPLPGGPTVLPIPKVRVFTVKLMIKPYCGHPQLHQPYTKRHCCCSHKPMACKCSSNLLFVPLRLTSDNHSRSVLVL